MRVLFTIILFPVVMAAAFSCTGGNKVVQQPLDWVPPFKGPEAALVTIHEFADFQCPYCARVSPTVKQLLSEYPDTIKLVFRQFPLSFHQNAYKAAEAMLAAQAGGKAWEMHDLMFANQATLDLDSLVDMAGTLGLDKGVFRKALEAGTYSGNVNYDLSLGEQAGVAGTPAFLINGVMLSGARPIDAFRTAVEAAKTRADALLKKGFTLAELESEFLREALAGKI